MKINKNSIRLHITSITWNISHLYLSVTLDVYLVVGELFSLNYRDCCEGRMLLVVDALYPKGYD
jgi:hypothetical protein